MPRKDLWKECYRGDHQRNLSPEDFSRLFCKRCRNPECENSAVGSSMWVNRMDTQVDRLLDNPVFGDINDPRYQHLREIDFEDAFRQAVAVEISSKKGDWSIPTEEEIDQFAYSMKESLPEGFRPSEKEEAQEEDDFVIDLIWEGEFQGSKNRTYKVTLAKVGDSKPTWSCTCPAMQYGRVGPEGCKHILQAKKVFGKQQEHEEAEKQEKTKTREGPAQKVDQETLRQMQEKKLLPQTQNTRFPSGGIMVDGTTPEKKTSEDPWQPKNSERVVPVGGKVVMGNSGEDS